MSEHSDTEVNYSPLSDDDSNAQRHTFTHRSMDLHLANAQTHILMALFNNNDNTILSTVPRSTTANPDSPHRAPLSHRQPHIPTAIFNNTSNNINNNSSGNIPTTVQHSTTHFWDLINTSYQPQASPTSRTRPNILQPPQTPTIQRTVASPNDGMSQTLTTKRV